MAREAIERALVIARERHEAITRGDIDAYAGREEALTAACDVLISGNAEVFTAGDVPSLDELIALETQSGAVLQQLMDEASARLGTLRHSERANRAYLHHQWLTVNGA